MAAKREQRSFKFFPTVNTEIWKILFLNSFELIFFSLVYELFKQFEELKRAISANILFQCNFFRSLFDPVWSFYFITFVLSRNRWFPAQFPPRGFLEIRKVDFPLTNFPASLRLPLPPPPWSMHNRVSIYIHQTFVYHITRVKRRKKSDWISFLPFYIFNREKGEKKKICERANFEINSK